MNSIDRAAVLGAGTMGHGIAQVLAQAGIQTRLYDIDDDRVQKGLDGIEANLKKGVERGKVAPEAAEKTRSHLEGLSDLDQAVAEADLVVEAVPEDLELKRRIFADLSDRVEADCIVATNTSSLSVTAIASAARGPERCIGLHFFNPVHLMALLEIVRGEETSEEVVSACRTLAERLGKSPIVVKDSPGFASSRLGIAIAMEAIRMVESGVASAEDIDTAMELGYRHPMGPIKLTDLVGLDVRLSIAEHLHRELGEVFRPPQLLKRLVRAGRLGKKAGRGFYLWD